MVPNKEEPESDSELTEEDATQPEQPEKPAEPAVENAVAEEPAAEEALQQIEDKHYARPFATDSRKLFKIGVNFSAETRNIEKWLVEN